MKKILWFFVLIFSVQLSAQTYPITSINISLPSNPDANTANGGVGTSVGQLTISAIAKMTNGKIDDRARDSRILVTIKKGGSKVCGSYSSGSAPSANFNSATKVWSGQTAISLLGQDCALPPGDYDLCVQFFGDGPVGITALSEEKCKSFTIRAKEQISYQAPQLLMPSNNSVISSEDSKKPKTFRWTSILPKPQEPVTYRLRVWQLMQGQNQASAMKTNQPIVTKDVDNITQAVINNLVDGPCKLPYLCDFVWNVQAINKEGKPIGSNNGMSGANEFSIMGNYGITIQNLVVECPKGTTYSFMVNVGNPNPSIAIFDKLEIVVVNGVTITPINITPTIPAIGSTIPANGNINVSASFTYGTPIITVCIKAFIKEQANPLLNTASSYTCDTLRCACDPCKTLGVAIKDDKLTTTASTSSQILLSGVLNGLNPANIKKITMELVYYNIEQTGDSNCVKCAENREWGNFIKPASSYFSGYNAGLLNGANFGREWTWLTTVQKECGGHADNGGGVDDGHNNGGGVPKCATCGTGSVPAPTNTDAKIANAGPVSVIDPVPNPVPKLNTFALPIAVPPGSSLKCCGDKIKICIRYTIWDFCCHACDIIKCYEIERKAQ